MSKTLTLKQQGFIDNYTNPENGLTYSNATQSYLQAHNGITYNTAKVEGCKNLTKPNIISEIDRVITELNMGSKVRLKRLNEVLTGNHTTTTQTTTQDAEGKEYTSKTIKSPTARDTLQAIDLLSKIDGTYDKNKVKADVMSSELKSLIKSHRKELEGG